MTLSFSLLLSFPKTMSGMEEIAMEVAADDDQPFPAPRLSKKRFGRKKKATRDVAMLNESCYENRSPVVSGHCLLEREL